MKVHEISWRCFFLSHIRWLIPSHTNSRSLVEVFLVVVDLEPGLPKSHPLPYVMCLERTVQHEISKCLFGRWATKNIVLLSSTKLVQQMQNPLILQILAPK